jgi:hypothetical protein
VSHSTTAAACSNHLFQLGAQVLPEHVPDDLYVVGVTEGFLDRIDDDPVGAHSGSLFVRRVDESCRLTFFTRMGTEPSLIYLGDIYAGINKNQNE